MNNNNPELPNHSDYQLPVVSMQIGESIIADAMEQGVSETFTQMNERLSANNPQLQTMVAQYLQGTGLSSDEAVGAAWKAMLLTHELLRRQAEVDSLNKQL